jgi:hypothetical protein
MYDTDYGTKTSLNTAMLQSGIKYSSTFKSCTPKTASLASFHNNSISPLARFPYDSGIGPGSYDATVTKNGATADIGLQGYGHSYG